MRPFIHVNWMSLYFGFLYVLEIQLFGNTYRIARLTGWGAGFTSTTILLTNIILLLAFGLFYVYYLSRRYKSLSSNVVLITCVTWLFYFTVLNRGFNHFFAVVRPEEQMNAAAGLIALAGTILYPVYILVVMFLGKFLNARTEKEK